MNLVHNLSRRGSLYLVFATTYLKEPCRSADDAFSSAGSWSTLEADEQGNPGSARCRQVAVEVGDTEWEAYPVLDLRKRKLYSRVLFEDMNNFVSAGSSIESFTAFVNKRLEAQALRVGACVL